MTNIPRKILVILIILFTPICHGLPADWPTEFTASYNLESYGIVIARSTYTLKHKTNSVEFAQNSKTVGLASLFKNETLHETSYLSLHKDRLLLDKYTHTQKGSDKNRDISLEIGWIVSDKKVSGRISGTAKGNPIQLAVNEPTWDTLSFQIPVMVNTKEKTPDWKASILVKGQLKNYEFTTHGIEEITIGGNTLKTIKVERKSNNNKPVFFWVAPELFNLPVRIEKWKNDKASITMLLEKAYFPSNKDVQFNSTENFDDL